MATHLQDLELAQEVKEVFFLACLLLCTADSLSLSLSLSLNLGEVR